MAVPSLALVHTCTLSLPSVKPIIFPMKNNGDPVPQPQNQEPRRKEDTRIRSICYQHVPSVLKCTKKAQSLAFALVYSQPLHRKFIPQELDSYKDGLSLLILTES